MRVDHRPTPARRALAVLLAALAPGRGGLWSEDQRTDRRQPTRRAGVERAGRDRGRGEGGLHHHRPDATAGHLGLRVTGLRRRRGTDPDPRRVRQLTRRHRRTGHGPGHPRLRRAHRLGGQRGEAVPGLHRGRQGVRGGDVGHVPGERPALLRLAGDVDARPDVVPGRHRGGRGALPLPVPAEPARVRSTARRAGRRARDRGVPHRRLRPGHHRHRQRPEPPGVRRPVAPTTRVPRRRAGRRAVDRPHLERNAPGGPEPGGAVVQGERGRQGRRRRAARDCSPSC